MICIVGHGIHCACSMRYMQWHCIAFMHGTSHDIGVSAARFLLAIKHTYTVEKFKNFSFSNPTRDPCVLIK